MSVDWARTLATITSNTTKAQNVDLLASDFQLSFADRIARISIAVTAAVKVRLVPSSGTGFYLNGGSALTANAVHHEDVALDTSRTWNISTDDAGGVTCTHLVVMEVAKA